MNNKYCYVFDFCAGAIYEIKLDDKDEDIEANDILDRRGLRDDQCSWMFVDKKLDVESINLKDDESI